MKLIVALAAALVVFAVAVAASRSKIEIDQHPIKSVFGCDACVYVATLLDRYLADNRTQAEIDAFLLEMCTTLPKDKQFECNFVMKSFAPIIVSKVIAAETPQVICTQLHLCSNSSSIAEHSAPETTDAAPAPSHADRAHRHEHHHGEHVRGAASLDSCNVCRKTVKRATKVFDKEKHLTRAAHHLGVAGALPPHHKLSKEERREFVSAMRQSDAAAFDMLVNGVLDMSCKSLESVSDAECQSFADQYADSFANAMLTGTKPKKICPLRGACSEEHDD